MSYIGSKTFEEMISRGDYSTFTKWSKIGFTPTMTTAISDIWSAAVISTAHTLLAVFVVASVIVSNDLGLLIGYSLGGGAGTYIGVKHGSVK
jgi:hypothetical protein